VSLRKELRSLEIHLDRKLNSQGTPIHPPPFDGISPIRKPYSMIPEIEYSASVAGVKDLGAPSVTDYDESDSQCSQERSQQVYGNQQRCLVSDQAP